MKKIVCLCASLMLVAACSKKNDPIQNARVAAKDKDLQAKSFSNCEDTPALGFEESFRNGVMGLLKAVGAGDANNTQNAAGSYSLKTSWKFEGDRVKRTSTYYAQAACKGDPSYTLTESGTFDVNKDQKVKSNDNGYPMDIEFSKLTATINNDQGAGNANNGNLCGSKDWAKGKEKNVTAQSKDKACYGAQLPRHVSNRYRVDGRDLYLGDVSKNPINDKDRPKTLANATKYTAE